MIEARRHRWWFAAAIVVPLVFFAIGPILLLVLRSVLSARTSMLSELSSAGGREALLNTLSASAGAALLALVIATPLSLLLYRTDLPMRWTLSVLFTLLSAIPPFILAMGWISLANPKAGYLNRVLGEGRLNIYSLAGIIFVLGTSELPLVLLAARASLSRIDSALEEAARMSGDGPLRALRTATLPLAWPALLSGAGLVFLSAAASFGVPYLLGVSATPPQPVLTTRIYGWILQGGSESIARANGLSIVLLILAGVVLIAIRVLGRSGRVRLLAGKGLAVRPLLLGRWKWPLWAATMVVLAIVVVLPLGALFLTSVQRTFGADIVWSELTVKHWGAVLRHPRTISAATSSLLLATGAATLVCVLGLAVAVFRQQGGRLGRWVETAAEWPFAVPGTVLALALIVAFSMNIRFVLLNRVAFVLALGDSAWLLVVAYVARHLALGTRNVSEGLEQLDPSLAESARIFGASPMRAFRDAVLPILRPALVVAFLLTFLASANELTMSVLLVPPGRELLGPLLFELQSYADPVAASVLASSFVLLVFVVLSVVRINRRRVRGGAR